MFRFNSRDKLNKVTGYSKIALFPNRHCTNFRRSEVTSSDLRCAFDRFAGGISFIAISFFVCSNMFFWGGKVLLNINH